MVITEIFNDKQCKNKESFGLMLMAAENYTNEDNQYLTENPVEIAQIITVLARNKTALNMSFNHGQDQGLTLVIGVSANKKWVYLDKSLDAGFNKRLIDSSTITFTKTDGVKIRWSAYQISEAKLKDGSALKIPLPESLYRFQRREFFRSPTPSVNPIICYIPYTNPTSQQEETLAMPLVDISLGGIGTVMKDHLSKAIEVEAEFDGCKITLPNYGELNTRLRVRHITDKVMANGSKKFQVGFQLTALTRVEERVLQQYVVHLEREALVLASAG